MPELKAGDTKTFQVGDKTLTIEPIPFGNLKKIMKIVMEAQEKTKSGIAEATLAGDYLTDIVPLLFKKGTHDFVTKEWLEDNLTLPIVEEIFRSALTVNGLGNFLGITVRTRTPSETEKSPNVPTTPPESSGSITSSGKPTDGPQERSTT